MKKANPSWAGAKGRCAVIANPIGFNIEGKQHVSIAASHSIFVFGL